ncbi:MAG: DUF3276 family protein [Bacteroidales bacterium]|nr:DUF3276 family protein [Bacteroidales bacterium]MDY6001318.1 DUF3276 family protein [Candidatus Cryptobacteroides sp.]
MFKEDQERPNYADRNSEDVFSIPVRAGKRTYFFDVKTTKGNNDYYLTITESKRRQEQDGSFTYDKHKIFLYKEDFAKFQEGLAQAVDYMKKNLLKDEGADAPEAQKAEGTSEQPSDKQEQQEGKDFTNVKFEEL